MCLVSGAVSGANIYILIRVVLSAGPQPKGSGAEKAPLSVQYEPTSKKQKPKKLRTTFVLNFPCFLRNTDG